MELSDLKILLVQVRHDEVLEEELSSIATTSGLSPSQFIPCIVFKELPHAGMLDGVHAVVLGGSGEYCVSERVISKEIEAMKALIREAYARKMPVLGICFGFHIIADALGGTVEQHRDIKEFGSSEVTRLPSAGNDPLFNDLPETFTVQQGHKDGVMSLPNDAIPLATSRLWLHQAFVMKDAPVYAVQFHPELNEKTLGTRLSAYLEHYLGDDRHEYERVLAGLKPSPEAAALLPKFLERIVIPHSHFN